MNTGGSVDVAKVKCPAISSADDGVTVTELPSVVDQANHTVTASIPHLTQVVLAAPKSVLFVPLGFSNVNLAGW